MHVLKHKCVRMSIHMCQCIQMYIMCVFMTYYVYKLMYKLSYENVNIYVNENVDV